MIETITAAEEKANDLLRNKKLLMGYFLYAVFSGALRKWVFMGSSGINNILLVIQLLFPFVIVYLMKREKSILSYNPLVPYTFVLIGLALNPINQSIFHGFFGILLHLGFWFILLAYLHERDSFPIENLIQPIIIVSFGQILLTFVQFALPLTHFLNRYESGGDDISGFEGGMVRVIGTFSYIGGYGAFVFFIGLLVWALMVENKRAGYIIYGLSLLGLLSGFMNGSRAIVLPFFMFLVFGFISYGSIVNKFKMVAILAGCLFLAGIYNVNKKFPSIEIAYNAFMGRVTSGQSTGENTNRTYEVFIEAVRFSGNYPIFGVGLGATYQGAISNWGKSEALKEYGYYEEEPERILLEGGYTLFTMRILLFLYFMFKSRIPIYFSAPILFYTFFLTQLTFSTNQATFTFFGLMLLDKMYYLKEKEVSGSGL